MKQIIYSYTKPNAMQGHRFTDDVAICVAESLDDAIEKFKRFYNDASADNVKQCFFNYLDVCILTDY